MSSNEEAPSSDEEAMPRGHAGGGSDEDEPEYDPSENTANRPDDDEEEEEEAKERSKRRKRLIKKSARVDEDVRHHKVLKRKRPVLSDEDEGDGAPVASGFNSDGEPAAKETRNRTVRRAVVASDEDEDDGVGAAAEDGEDDEAEAEISGAESGGDGHKGDEAADEGDQDGDGENEADGDSDKDDDADVIRQRRHRGHGSDEEEEEEQQEVEEEEEEEEKEDFPQKKEGNGESSSRRLSKKGRREEYEDDGNEEEKDEEIPQKKSGKGKKKAGSPSVADEREAAEFDSEEDVEGQPMREDENFIDDEGVNEEDHARYGSDEEAASAGDAPQAIEGEADEEVDEIAQMLKPKKKKQDKLEPEEVALMVERFMAKLDNAADKDAEANRKGQPAINKLKMLPELVATLRKRHLQQEFLDRGVLTGLKNWIEPLPDGSLPNMNIRSAILQLVTDLPIDVEQPERRDQLKKSGLGKVVMFLSKLPEEIHANRKLAHNLVDKWSRPIFEKSTRYEDLRMYEEQRSHVRRLPPKPDPEQAAHTPRKRVSGDLDLENDSTAELKPGDPGYQRSFVYRPEAVNMDYKVRPESRVREEEMKRREKGTDDPQRQKMNKTLLRMRAPKKKNIRAEKISVEGRGLVKFI